MDLELFKREMHIFFLVSDLEEGHGHAFPVDTGRPPLCRAARTSARLVNASPPENQSFKTVQKNLMYTLTKIILFKQECSKDFIFSLFGMFSSSLKMFYIIKYNCTWLVSSFKYEIHSKLKIVI